MMLSDLRNGLAGLVYRLAPGGTRRRALLARLIEDRSWLDHYPELAQAPDKLEQVRAGFDEAFYLQNNPDVAAAGLDPFRHFMRYGWREGRDPSPVFSIGWYLRHNADIQAGGINPFVHWMLYGRDEGRARKPTDPHLMGGPLTELGQERVRAAFDAEFYLHCNPDVADEACDPFDHYMDYGWREGRNPSRAFATGWYVEQNPDIESAGINPFVHWVLHGRDEGRPGCSLEDAQGFDELDTDWDRVNPDQLAAIAEDFDAEFYLRQYPYVAGLGVDPAVHYLLVGWAKHYDPAPEFSTGYYMARCGDIARSGMNPFVHWCLYGRHELRETQSYVARARRDFRPLVSVIVPNYNHAAYLPQRLRSIAEQSYDNLEIIILDDKSPDNSREVIRQTVAELGLDARLVFNERNSGNVFRQWRKGLELASGDLVWICESDDFCAPDFLEHLIPAFAEESVNIAFGRIQFADGDGHPFEGLDGYREGAEPGVWGQTLTRSAFQWFDNGFGVNNVIANVGGCVFRRMDLPDTVWDTAQTYKICGDWYLYIQIAGAGQITYEPRSVAWFRQHGRNTSASNFNQRYYYEENSRILAELVHRWGIRAETRENFIAKVRAQYTHFRLAETLGDFDTVFGTKDRLAAGRGADHVQLHFLGFHTGGGELFPINLANAFTAAGMTVSMVASEMSQVNADMRARLDRRVPVYHSNDLALQGREAFLRNTGVSVINSHVANSDAALAHAAPDPIEVPYVVTLHGSYVGLEEAPKPIVDWILENVTSWVYTADRNLEFFEERAVDWDNFFKLHNAMPRDPRPAPFTREELGIAPGDTVFTLVARGIKRKGWRASVEAFRALREKHGIDSAHLLLIGDGASTDEARALAQDLEGVHFLGYQSAINGILRLSDCLILPTRFEGESYPLCLIQAIQEHLPSIATDIGEIRSMMTSDAEEVAGILLKNQRDSRAYFAALTQAMAEMCDPERRAGFARVAAARARFFDMDVLVASYQDIYREAQRKFTRS